LRRVDLPLLVLADEGNHRVALWEGRREGKKEGGSEGLDVDLAVERERVREEGRKGEKR